MRNARGTAAAAILTATAGLGLVALSATQAGAAGENCSFGGSGNPGDENLGIGHKIPVCLVDPTFTGSNP